MLTRWIALFLVALFSCQASWAGAALDSSLPNSPQTPAKQVELSSEGATQPRLYSGIGYRRPKQLDVIYDYDDTPLGERTPVLLLPGRAEEHQLASWWRKVWFAARKHPDFQQHYKLYVYLYDSRTDIDDQVERFHQLLKTDFYPAIGEDQQVMLVTYSLGGIIAQRTFLKYPELLERIEKVWGIAAPYQGAPIFSTPWFEEFSQHPSPIRRFWDKQVYRLYFSNKQHLARSMYWENFDRTIPKETLAELEQFHDVDNWMSHDQPKPEAEQAFQDKLIVYGSYLENGLTEGKLPRYLKGWNELLIQIPKTVFGILFPAYGVTVHGMMDYLSWQLANTPTYTPNEPEGINQHDFRYNDGVIPLSSALYLDPSPQAYTQNWKKLATLSPVCYVRVFPDLDHVDLGHYRFVDGHLVSRDAFHPDEGERTPNEWLLHDLMTFTEGSKNTLSCQGASQSYN